MHLEESQGTPRHITTGWWNRRNQILIVGGAALLAVVLLGALLARYIVRRGWPQTEGTLPLAGLHAPVTVVRDGYGVPHIFAKNEADLHFAQGYVHAQDRFWEMELNRRRGRGTLTEILGDAALADDEAWRTLNLPGTAQNELSQMSAEARASLDSYVGGVNAWLDQHGGALPLEFALLGWRGRTVGDPAPWTTEDLLLVSLVLSWQMGASPVEPSLEARIIDRVGLERGAFLLGTSSEDHLVSLSGPGFLQEMSGLTQELPRRWVLCGRVTLGSADPAEGGEPLWAVDLPTDLGLPAPWYVMAWRVGEAGAAGASLPGLPGLLVGTDDWGLWETWAGTGQLDLSSEDLPWKGWLLSATLSQGKIGRLDAASPEETLEGMMARLTDTFSPRASRLIPLLVQVKPEEWRQERVTGMLRKWDYHVGDNNKEAPFFAVYQLETARAAFADELGADLFEAYVAQSDRYQAALDRILEDPDDDWWDDVTTSEREMQGDILKQAYEPALEWIGRNYGDLHMLWEWDIVHGSRLHHPLGDPWPWDQLFNRELFPDGWADTQNASPGGLPCLGGMCQGGDLYRAKAVYGYRQIVDADDPSVLWFSLLPGQSGHPFHAHYDDLMDEWLAGEYLPLRLAPSPAEVEGTEGVLILTPRQ